MSKHLREFIQRFDASDVLVLVGLLLVGVGTWQVHKPAALIVVGAIVLFCGMPSRPPFIGGSK